MLPEQNDPRSLTTPGNANASVDGGVCSPQRTVADSSATRWRLTKWRVMAGAGFALLAVALPAFRGTGGAETTRSDRGITYSNDRVGSVPWSIHVAKVDRSDPSLELHSVLGRGRALGLAPLSQQAMGIPASVGTPLAAINGDFYQREGSTYPGDPRGIQIVDGELVSAPGEQAVFWIDAGGQPQLTNVVKSQFRATWPDGRSLPFGLNEDRGYARCVLYTAALGRATRNRGTGLELTLEKSGDGPWLPLRPGETYTVRIRDVKQGTGSPLSPDIMVLALGPVVASNVTTAAVGTILTLSTETVPSLKGARTAIGGGSVITRQGKPARIEKPQGAGGREDYSLRSMFERHPRAMFGWSKTHYVLAEVDGRQRELSVGMTLEELGQYMAKLGCEEAMSLDGGGSATFWYRGRVMNSPCDGNERPIANGLVVVRKPSAASP